MSNYYQYIKLLMKNKSNIQKKIVKILKDFEDGTIKLEEAAIKIEKEIDEIVSYCKKENKEK